MVILALNRVGVGENLKPKQLESLDIFLFGKEFNKWWGDRWSIMICYSIAKPLDCWVYPKGTHDSQ